MSLRAAAAASRAPRSEQTGKTNRPALATYATWLAATGVITEAKAFDLICLAKDNSVEDPEASIHQAVLALLAEHGGSDCHALARWVLDRWLRELAARPTATAGAKDCHCSRSGCSSATASSPHPPLNDERSRDRPGQQSQWRSRAGARWLAGALTEATKHPMRAGLDSLRRWNPPGAAPEPPGRGGLASLRLWNTPGAAVDQRSPRPLRPAGDIAPPAPILHTSSPVPHGRDQRVPVSPHFGMWAPVAPTWWDTGPEEERAWLDEAQRRNGLTATDAEAAFENGSPFGARMADMVSPLAQPRALATKQPPSPSSQPWPAPVTSHPSQSKPELPARELAPSSSTCEQELSPSLQMACSTGPSSLPAQQPASATSHATLPACGEVAVGLEQPRVEDSRRSTQEDSHQLMPAPCETDGECPDSSIPWLMQRWALMNERRRNDPSLSPQPSPAGAQRGQPSPVCTRRVQLSPGRARSAEDVPSGIQPLFGLPRVLDVKAQNSPDNTQRVLFSPGKNQQMLHPLADAGQKAESSSPSASACRPQRCANAQPLQQMLGFEPAQPTRLHSVPVRRYASTGSEQPMSPSTLTVSGGTASAPVPLAGGAESSRLPTAHSSRGASTVPTPRAGTVTRYTAAPLAAAARYSAAAARISASTVRLAASTSPNRAASRISSLSPAPCPPARTSSPPPLSMAARTVSPLAARGPVTVTSARQSHCRNIHSQVAMVAQSVSPAAGREGSCSPPPPAPSSVTLLHSRSMVTYKTSLCTEFAPQCPVPTSAPSSPEGYCASLTSTRGSARFTPRKGGASSSCEVFFIGTPRVS